MVQEALIAALRGIRTDGPGPGDGTGGCDRTPEYAALYPCGGGSGGSGQPSYAVGRVGDDVAAVTARYADGSSSPAAVDNGWFLLLIEDDAPRLDALVASNAAGEVLDTVDARDPRAVVLPSRSG